MTAVARVDHLLPIIARIEREAASSYDRMIETAATRMVAPAERWRIVRAIYGASVPAMWPPVGKQPGEMLIDARAKIAAQRHFARTTPRLFDMNALVAAQQAERALTQIIFGGGK